MLHHVMLAIFIPVASHPSVIFFLTLCFQTYTINDESTHLLVFGVPSIGLAKELKHACSKYGIVKVVKLVPDYPDVEAFTQVFHVQYLKLQSAR